MFDGKTFFPVTGIPMRKIACMSKLFALAEPVPLTVPILNAKSLMRDAGRCSDIGRRLPSAALRERHHVPCFPPTTACFTLLDPSVRNQQFELAHVPRRRWAPLGAEAAM